MNVENLLRNPLLRPSHEAATPLQSLGQRWVGGEVTHRIANPSEILNKIKTTCCAIYSDIERTNRECCEAVSGTIGREVSA